MGAKNHSEKKEHREKSSTPLVKNHIHLDSKGKLPPKYTEQDSVL